MSDKPLVQQALASDLAEILLTIPTPKRSLSFLRGFWEAIVREWSGIDRLRSVSDGANNLSLSSEDVIPEWTNIICLCGDLSMPPFGCLFGKNGVRVLAPSTT